MTLGRLDGPPADRGILWQWPSGKNTPERRYSPAVCTGSREQVITGNPDPDFISTSHVERSNLTIRMSIRRFTRLTNAFSKKLDNHKAALALHFMYLQLRPDSQDAAGDAGHGGWGQ